jgi:hypothetical protein
MKAIKNDLQYGQHRTIAAEGLFQAIKQELSPVAVVYNDSSYNPSHKYVLTVVGQQIDDDVLIVDVKAEDGSNLLRNGINLVGRKIMINGYDEASVIKHEQQLLTESLHIVGVSDTIKNHDPANTISISIDDSIFFETDVFDFPQRYNANRRSCKMHGIIMKLTIKTVDDEKKYKLDFLTAYINDVLFHKFSNGHIPIYSSPGNIVGYANTVGSITTEDVEESDILQSRILRIPLGYSNVYK